jgi:hypothetical protein
MMVEVNELPLFHLPTTFHAQVLPAAPMELVCELSKRYVYLYEKITGEQFQVMLWIL